MSRYIDVEWLEDNAKEYSLGYYEDDEWATPLNVLDSAPSIDIVRCGECKHWCKGDEVYGICYRCPNTRQMQADDFCSYGSKNERSE